MFKKIKIFLILLILSFSVISCSKPSFNTISSSLRISKPSLDYYTKYLKHSISKKIIQLIYLYSIQKLVKINQYL